MIGKTPVTVLMVLVIVAVFPVYVSQKAAAQTSSSISIQMAFPQLSFNQPVGIYNAADGSNRLFVVEQAGRILVFSNSPTTSAATVFLDISDRVLFAGEQGLLGLAFHPNFIVNGFLYVDYVRANPTRTVIARFTLSASNPNQADNNSEFTILEISQPFSNHKGGEIAFGPDGYFYVGMGDGGSGGDPLGNGQNRSTLLGKILRIDVNTISPGRNYGIPLDNPFVGNTAGYREEIYAYGFRNPWRFSFDTETGRLWVGDVGQDRLEEIDNVEKGKNYGWNIMEGTLPYAGGSQTGLELPVFEYDHTLGIAIVGGYVYHGAAISSLPGKYVYGDYGSGRIWMLSLSGTNSTTNTLLVSSNLSISSFGTDEAGELYISALDGKIYKFASVAIPEIPFVGAIVVLAISSHAVIFALKRRKSSQCKLE